MRITHTEKGKAYGLRGNSDIHYTLVYTQPIHWIIIAKTYHWYEMRSHRIWDWLWKVFPHKKDLREYRGKIYDMAMPFCVRQSCRCHVLTQRGRIVVSREEREV